MNTQWVTKSKCDQFLSKISIEKCQIGLYCLHYAKAWIIAKLVKESEMTIFQIFQYEWRAMVSLLFVEIPLHAIYIGI